MPPLDLTDADRLKQVVVDPLVCALRAEMREQLRPLVHDIAALRVSERQQNLRFDRIEQRLGSIERFKMKIATVCSAIGVLAGIAWSMLADWIRNHLLRPH